jgi:hypothetical protein
LQQYEKSAFVESYTIENFKKKRRKISKLLTDDSDIQDNFQLIRLKRDLEQIKLSRKKL